jgi:hypothetical protein
VLEKQIDKIEHDHFGKYHFGDKTCKVIDIIDDMRPKLIDKVVKDLKLNEKV